LSPPPRVDGPVVVAAALLFGATAATSAVPATVGAVAVLVLLGRRLGSVAVIAAVLAFALSAVRAASALSHYEAARVRARDALGPYGRCAGHGTIVTSPARLGSLRYLAQLDQLSCNDRAVPVPLLAQLYGGPDDLGRGDVLSFVADLGPLSLFRNPELPDPMPAAARGGAVVSGGTLAVIRERRGRGWQNAVDRARTHARRRIDATFAPLAAPLARALVLGENDLDPDDGTAFKQSGLMHLLAVSGTHLVFAVVLLVRCLAFVAVRVEWIAARIDARRIASALGALLALLYADFSGGSGSAWRAAWMLAASLLVHAIGRHVRATRPLAISLVVGAIVDPLAAFDLSFLLSAAATTGLLTVGRSLGERASRLSSTPVRHIAQGLAATVSAMVPCAPLLAVLSPELTVAGIAANVIAAPVGEIAALPICLVHSLLSGVPSLERGAALVGSGALLAVRAVARTSASMRALAFAVPAPGPWHFVLLAVGGVGIALASGRVGLSARAHRALWLGATLFGLAVVEWSVRRAARPGELRITAIDVGQGDSLLVDFPDGQVLLLDGGGFVGSPIDPGQRILLPLLRARRRSAVDVVVLSHPHPDHFGGLVSALPHFAVGEFWDTGQGAREGAGPKYAELLSGLAARRVPIQRPDALCGKPRWFGQVRVDVLAPCPDFVAHRGANDNSFVLRITYGHRRALLVGDTELTEESQLVSRWGTELATDLLKVGHHGSRTSSGEAFLAHARPKVALISCGTRNRYAHPHVEALERLTRAGALILRVDRSGGTLWQTDGETWSVFAFSVPH
jgi:competence protein ComEC